MSETLDLLNWRPAEKPAARCPHNGTITSRLAAAEIVPHADGLRQRVLDCLKAAPAGLTDEEIQQQTGIEGSTERPRRQELERQGKVFKTGAVRPTKSGRSALIWYAQV